MISIILTIEVALFVVTSFFMMPAIVRRYKGFNSQNKLGIYAWSAMAIGAHQLLKHEQLVQGVGSFGAAAYYQLIWMTVAGLLLLLLMATSKLSLSAWKPPMIAFALYVFSAYVSAAVSVAPMMTIYRASQIAIDLILALVIYSGLRRSEDSRLLMDVTLFWLVVLLFTVGLGAILFPDRAFVEAGGSIGTALRGVIPLIHQNELGLMAAIGLVLSVMRVFGGEVAGSKRLFWFALMLLSGTILFLTQARTSIAGGALALILSGIMVKRMRWLSYTVAIAAVIVLLYYWLSGSNLGIEDDVTEYLRRGGTDEQIQSLSGRTDLWATGWEMFKDSPVIGHGYAAGVRYEGVKYGLRLGTNMHSSHMQVLVDLGAVGYLFWVLFVFGSGMVVYRNYRYTRVLKVNNPVAVEALLIVIVILFRSILGHVLVTHQLNLMIFLSIYIYAVINLDARAAFGKGRAILQSDKRKHNLITGDRKNL